eukprot:scaffold7791_cov457-Prasinococcus_capsulatus_cf.AAC.3
MMRGVARHAALWLLASPPLLMQQRMRTQLRKRSRRAASPSPRQRAESPIPRLHAGRGPVAGVVSRVARRLLPPWSVCTCARAPVGSPAHFLPQSAAGGALAEVERRGALAYAGV